MANSLELGREVTSSLGYLLKHAHLELDAATTRALEPFGFDPRSLGVLRVLASREPNSQQEIAHLFGVDRTTMVALIDALENAELVSRHASIDDRRRNVIELTSKGSDIFAQAEAAAKAAEETFLNEVPPHDAALLRDTLHLIVTGERLKS